MQILLGWERAQSYSALHDQIFFDLQSSSSSNVSLSDIESDSPPSWFLLLPPSWFLADASLECFKTFSFLSQSSSTFCQWYLKNKKNAQIEITPQISLSTMQRLLPVHQNCTLIKHPVSFKYQLINKTWDYNYNTKKLVNVMTLRSFRFTNNTAFSS